MFKVDDEYGFLTKELLELEYCTNKLTDKQISEKYNVGSKVTIWRRRKHHGIENRLPNKSNKNAAINRKFVISKEEALEWQQNGKTWDEMATIVGCSRMVLYRRLKEIGLIEDCPEAMKKLKWNESLSDCQLKFILGDLLGDGSITPQGMYQCSHSYKQKTFIEYKYDLLHNLMSPNFNFKERIVKNYQNGNTYKTYHLRTMVNINLKKIRKEFYSNEEKIFPLEYLKKSSFNDVSLAAWYMGDGGRKSNMPSLYTYGFEYGGNLDILIFLFDRFGVAGEIKEAKDAVRNEKKKFYISFGGDNAKKFFSLVAPHMIPYFNYKLPESYRTL